MPETTPHDTAQDWTYTEECKCHVRFLSESDCRESLMFFNTKCERHNGPGQEKERTLLHRRAKRQLVEAIHGNCDHVWTGQQMGGPPDVADSYEWVEYCEKCGLENPGSWVE